MSTIKEFLKPELIWFMVGLVLLMLEFALPGLIIFFFGVGAWVVSIICFITKVSINIQLGVFLVTSVLCLVLLRKWLKGIFLGHTENTQKLTEEMKEFVGERAVVVEDISAQKQGKVEIHGTYWSAQADQNIAAGTAVMVISKDNLVLTVESV